MIRNLIFPRPFRFLRGLTFFRRGFSFHRGFSFRHCFRFHRVFSFRRGLTFFRRGFSLFLFFILFLFPSPAQTGDAQRVYLGIRDRLAPSVVRIETAGGDETVLETVEAEGREVGSGAAGKGNAGEEHVSIREISGVFVSSDGFLVSSAVGFAHHPDAVIVITSDGTHHPARVVCTDLGRKITLLKIEGTGFSVPPAAKLSEMRTGQKILTLGRVLNPEIPSITTGILSGLNRQHGRAVQTDAHVSPDNYGGPLVNLRGEVLGILTPFGMGENTLFSGVELYDSGVGFAVPLEQILTILPRMKETAGFHENHTENAGDSEEKSADGMKDAPARLLPAPKLGVTFNNPAPILSDTTVLYVHPDTPAAAAGIEAGDRITAMDGTPVARGSDFQAVLAQHWEGDTLRVTLERKKKVLEVNIVLKNLEKKKEK